METNKRENKSLGDLGKVIEVDAAGAALTPDTVAQIEEELTPLRNAGFTHVDLLVKRVSIAHLGENTEAQDGTEVSKEVGPIS